MLSRDQADHNRAEHGPVDLCALSCPDRSDARMSMIERNAVLLFVDPFARRALTQRMVKTA